MRFVWSGRTRLELTLRREGAAAPVVCCAALAIARLLATALRPREAPVCCYFASPVCEPMGHTTPSTPSTRAPVPPHTHCSEQAHTHPPHLKNMAKKMSEFLLQHSTDITTVRGGLIQRVPLSIQPPLTR